MPKGIIVLENGSSFLGETFGYTGTKFGEFVFNTALSGYQEILTDPSYKGQFVVMTYPHIGNYGTSPEDAESDSVFLEGFIAKEFSSIVSNYRSQKSLQDYLTEKKVIAIQGVDTRAITKLIREKGSMMGAISNTELDPEKLLEQIKKAPSIVGVDMIKEVTTKKIFKWDPSKNQAKSLHPNTSVYDAFTKLKDYHYGFHIVCIDCGVKWNMLRILSLMGCEVTVVPATSKIDEIRKLKPDGVIISNGPGDPSAVPYLVQLVKDVIDAGLPTFGICFGHQLIGQAFGGKTFKLKFGHHGANHPVKDLLTGKVEITSQNHNFCVDYESLDKTKIEITHMHLNDDTVEGFRHKEKPVFSVQYHPESSPGPSDSRYLFKRFLDMVKEARHA